MPSYQTPQPIYLSVELPRGTVHLIASERTDTVATVNPSDRNSPEDVDAAGKTDVDFANGTLFVKRSKLRGIAGHVVGWRGSGSVDVVAEVPQGSSLTADVGFADLRCDGPLGDVEVTTGAGNVRLDQTGALRVRSGASHITVEKVTGSVEIVTAGDIIVGSVAGKGDIKNLNGKTWIGRVGGDLKVRSSNGDVTIDEADSDVAVRTANGNIRLGQVVRGGVTVVTAIGELEIGVAEGTAAWVDASTKFGRVESRLTATDQPELSDDTVEVRARTGFGDVLITRAQAH